MINREQKLNVIKALLSGVVEYLGQGAVGLVKEYFEDNHRYQKGDYLIEYRALRGFTVYRLEEENGAVVPMVIIAKIPYSALKVSLTLLVNALSKIRL